MSAVSGARRRATRISVLSIFALVLLGGGVARAASEVPGETFAASVDQAGEYAAGGVKGDPTISADGGLVNFVTAATNLSSEAAGVAQAYVKDLDSGEVILASRGEGALGAAADSGVETSLLAAGGRYVVFQTAAEDLVADLPAGPVAHVYRRDLQSGETVLVDRADGAEGEIVPLAASLLAVSADGRLVAFSDPAQELDDPNGAHAAGEMTIYVRDLEAGRTIEIAAEGAEEASFSADDQYLLFTSAGAALPEPTGSFEVYRRDLQSGETLLVSRTSASGPEPTGEAADGEAYEAVFVGSSECRIAFLGEGTTNLNPAGEDPPRGIYIRDFCSSPSTTTLVSINEEGEPFEQATFPSPTSDGRVAFLAQNFAFEPRHFYLRDVDARKTIELDLANGVDGEPANGEIADQGAATVAANGCRAVFTTNASNLLGKEEAIPGSQTFVRQLAPCKPTPPAGPEEGGPPPVDRPAPAAAPAPAASPPALARRVDVAHLGKRAVRLSFDGAGRARLRIQRLAANGRGQWTLVESLAANAPGPGIVRVPLPRLAPGRYRLKLRLQGNPDNPTLTRRLVLSGMPPA
jgi:hypothetical protein